MPVEPMRPGPVTLDPLLMYAIDWDEAPVLYPLEPESGLLPRLAYGVLTCAASFCRCFAPRFADLGFDPSRFGLRKE